MILYTIIPDEFIFGNIENSDFKDNYTEVDYLGEKVQVMQTVGNKYVINRIISTSPKAYLDPRLQPGVIITI